MLPGMANSWSVTASGVSGHVRADGTRDAGNRLIAKLLGLPAEEFQAQFTGPAYGEMASAAPS